LLESDERINNAKGAYRPINTQRDRANVLAALSITDFIILLPFFHTDQEYDTLISSIKPAIIATTAGDVARVHKERQAARLHIQLVDVVQRIQNQSTSRLAALLQKEL
jgi:bifunctional ADP-heptose synthase (sugar kinase/adenylyltransferase)